MKRPMNDVRFPRWAPAGLAFAAVMMLALSPAAAQRSRPSRRPRRPARPLLKAGTEAPDFELSRLTLEKDEKGNPVGKLSKEKVKLSSFRGKKVVCIFSSSYT